MDILGEQSEFQEIKLAIYLLHKHKTRNFQGQRSNPQKRHNKTFKENIAWNNIFWI